MPYVYFTQEERQKARTTDLAAFLRDRGETSHRSGSEHMWLCSGQKVTLRGNLWFHHYTQTGGDAVEFVCRFYHLDYPDAVKLLLQSGVPCAETIPEIYPQRQLVLPRRNENMRRVSAYLLRQRGIDQEVLDAFAYRNLIWESLPYHNAVFLGCDPEGQPRHAHLRSTAARGTYKGNAPGSRPEYSFHWIGAGDALFLFESPIDLLSYLSMHKSGCRKNSYAAACGVSDKVLWQCLQDYSQLKKVLICLDNDNPGKIAAEKISQKLEQKNIEHAILVPRYKDWNEDLLHL